MKYIGLVLITTLLIVGCSGNNNVEKQTPFIGGSEGLSMRFLPESPPDFVFDDGKGEFGILVELENVGEATIEPSAGYVEIIGINPRDFGLSNQSSLLEGINTRLMRSRKNFEGTIIKGDRTVVEFPQLSYERDLFGNTETTIRAELCYDYKTSTSTNVCVKRDVLSTGLDTRKICDVSGEKDPQNSGAPIHITSLKEAPIGDDKIQLIFEIEHVGPVNGQIYKRGTICDDTITNSDRNKIFISVTSDVDGRYPECSGLQDRISPHEGYVTLYDGQKHPVTCTLDLAGVNSIFEEVFTVELDYRYGQFIEKKMTIRDVST